MPELVHHFCKLFADDTKLLAVIRDSKDIDIAQKDLDALVNWSKVWKMKFNEDKCKVMHFERAKYDILNKAFSATSSNRNWDSDPHARHHKFTMTDLNHIQHTLEETENDRDLGVHIDCKLKWRIHIALITAKAYSIMGSLKLFLCSLVPCSLFTGLRTRLEYFTRHSLDPT